MSSVQGLLCLHNTSGLLIAASNHTWFCDEAIPSFAVAITGKELAKGTETGGALIELGPMLSYCICSLWVSLMKRC